jgi:hypothetical protein
MDELTKRGHDLIFTMGVSPIDHNTRVRLVAGGQHMTFIGVGNDATIIHTGTEVRVERWHPELGGNGSVEGKKGWLLITIVGSEDEHPTL